MSIRSIIAKTRIGMRDRLLRFANEDLVRIARVRQANKVFKRNLPYLKPLQPDQEQEILDFWAPYRKIDKKELRWFAFYNANCDDKSQLKYYIPDIIFHSEIDLHFTAARRCDDLDDKNLYDLFFHGVKMPRTVVRKINGEYLDEDYQVITLDQAVELCVEAGQVVYKEARLSLGGHGVHFYDLSGNDAVQELRSRLTKEDNINVQRVINQHECLNNIHRNSINTVRIMSLMLDGKVHLLSSVLRMGRDGSRVDNACSGGIVCGINEDGTLKEFAYNTRGAHWDKHPQGLTFKGYKIVGYDKCCELVKTLAGRLSTATQLVSWDLAVGEDGEPVLIEANFTWGEIDFHQLCNGPILGDLTQEVLSRVYQKSK